MHGGIKFLPEGSGVQYRAMEGGRGLAGDGELTKGHSALLAQRVVRDMSIGFLTGRRRKEPSPTPTVLSLEEMHVGRLQ